MIKNKLEEIAFVEIETLVEHRVRESLYLYFKAELQNGNDAGTREFLADVSAFANTQGGDVFLG